MLISSLSEKYVFVYGGFLLGVFLLLMMKYSTNIDLSGDFCCAMCMRIIDDNCTQVLRMNIIIILSYAPFLNFAR